MQVLNLIENHGYDGTYTSPIAVSESKEKLENLIETLKKEAIEMKKIWETKEKELEKKYSPLRENLYRTKEEVEERKIEFSNILNLFKNRTKIRINFLVVLEGSTSFDIEKIELI